MAAHDSLTGTFTTYDSIGNREDLSNLISDISPTDTPLQSNIGSAPCENTYFEWQTDALDTAAQNHSPDGFNITTMSSVTATVRLGNYTSLSEKDFAISGTQQAVNKAGRGDEIAYQAMKAAKALKRDVEVNLTANNAAVAGSDPSTARETGGLAAFIKTNTDKSATNGTDPVWTSAPTGARSDGTARASTETILQSALKKAYDQGGDPSLVMVGSFQKQKFSAFAGIAAQRFMAGSAPTTIVGAADLYISDFGTLAIVPNRFQPAHYAYVLEPEKIRKRVLRDYEMNELGKLGDSDRRMFTIECGLQVENEKALAIMADLATS